MTNISTLAEFPVRPIVQKGESLSGYCWRAHAANGHVVQEDLLLAMHSFSEDMDAGSELGYFLGEELFEAARDSLRKQLSRWGGRSKPPWYRLANNVRFCPQCLANGGYHIQFWSFPLVRACQIHKVELTDCCFECRRMYRWDCLHDGWVCNCGAHIAHSPSRPATKAHLRLTEILASARDAPLPTRLKPREAFKFEGIERYRLSEIYEALWWTARAREELRGSAGRGDYTPYGSRNPSDFSFDPGLWEVRQLSTAHRSQLKRGLRVFRGLFRDDFNVVVDLRYVPAVYELMKLTEKMSRSSNRFLRTTRFAAVWVGKTRLIQFQGLEHIYLNPSLRRFEQTSYIYAFNQWWRSFASEVATLKKAAALRDSTGQTSQSKSNARRDVDKALQLTNLLFDVATKFRDPSLFDYVKDRWHLPEEIKLASGDASKVVRYIYGLADIELEFVLRLVDRRLDAIRDTKEGRTNDL